MPGGAVRLAGLGAGPPSRLCHKDPLFWPQPALGTEMTVSDEGWGSVSSQRLSRQGSAGVGLGQCAQVAGLEQTWRSSTLLHDNTQHTVLLCYIATPGTLCYIVTLPHAHCVMLQYTYCIVHRAHMYIWRTPTLWHIVTSPVLQHNVTLSINLHTVYQTHIYMFAIHRSARGGETGISSINGLSSNICRANWRLM